MSEPVSGGFPITSWAEDDRPREKLIFKGRNALSDAELLAILIGSGTKKMTAVDLAKIILNDHRQNLNELACLSVSQLMNYKGIGEAKAISIAAALELGRRRQMAEVVQRRKISSSRDIFDFMQPKLSDLNHEEFHVIYLKNNMHIHKEIMISKGGITGTVADVRQIMHYALDNKTTGLILCHNHPSGSVNPSNADIQLTKKIKEACQIMDFSLYDHVIVSSAGYYSFADEGKL